MELRNISKENKGINYLLTCIDIYTKFVWVVPLLNKSTRTVLNAFDSIISKLDQKPLDVLSDLGIFVKLLFSVP